MFFSKRSIFFYNSQSNEDEEEEESSLGDQGIEEDAGANEEEADSDDYSDIDSGNEDDLESFVESMSSIRSSPEKVVQVEDKHDKEIKKCNHLFRYKFYFDIKTCKLCC